MPRKINAIFLVLILAFTSCNETPVPRPRGFFRIDLPESKPVTLDLGYPYSFTYQDYGIAAVRNKKQHKKHWVDIIYPQFKGTLHISYREVNNNLGELIEDAHTMVMKHIPKSSGIDEIRYDNPGNKVYGMGYYIKGSEAASPYQFFVTDSTDHFLRGALYFNALPNNDSLSPVIDFLRKDIENIISTINWETDN